MYLYFYILQAFRKRCEYNHYVLIDKWKSPSVTLSLYTHAGIWRQLSVCCYIKNLKMRVRPEHWAVLLEMCEKNPGIMVNKFRGPEKEKYHALWLQVTRKLNGLGFGKKSAVHWRKTFTDWKSKTKAKAAKINKNRKAIENGKVIVPLSEHEIRLLGLVEKTSVGKTARKVNIKKIKLDESWEEEEKHSPETPIGNGLQEFDLLKQLKQLKQFDQSWQEGQITLIVHSDDESEPPPSPDLEESLDLIEPKVNDHDYNQFTYSTRAQNHASVLSPPDVKKPFDPIKPEPDDHNYNRPTASTAGAKKPLNYDRPTASKAAGVKKPLNYDRPTASTAAGVKKPLNYDRPTASAADVKKPLKYNKPTASAAGDKKPLNYDKPTASAADVKKPLSYNRPTASTAAGVKKPLNYNRPTASTAGVKKLLRRQKVRRYQESQLISNKLSAKTLKTLRNIDKNTLSMAESLKIIAASIKKRVQ